MAGAALMALGGLGGDVAALARGYGLLLALSAGWLLGGLAVRSAFRRRSMARVSSPPVRQAR